MISMLTSSIEIRYYLTVLSVHNNRLWLTNTKKAYEQGFDVENLICVSLNDEIVTCSLLYQMIIYIRQRGLIYPRRNILKKNLNPILSLKIKNPII